MKLTDSIDFTKYRRFFAFGCSFTRYHWPTWADIISQEIVESYNYGAPGGGNQYIFSQLMEADQRFSFNETDLIIVFWTNVAREDRYINTEWVIPGNIYSKSFYDDNYIKKYSCNRGYFIRDAAIIKATKIFLESKKVDYDFLSMIPLNGENQFFHKEIENIKDIVILYADILSSIKPSIYETIYNYDWWKNTEDNYITNQEYDSHPTVLKHLHYLQYSYPKTSFLNNTIEFANSEHMKFKSSTFISTTKLYGTTIQHRL